MLEADADRGQVLAQLTAVQAAVGAARRALIGELVSACAEAVRSEPRADVRTEAVSRLVEVLRPPLSESRWKGDVAR
jgi:DNA-binding FrmR family transcriptional regulator